MERILRFEAIEIEKIPGFNPPGFAVRELNPQMNIIFGPNAVGKTTLARALRHIIWPESSLAGTNIIRGNFYLAENSWFVNIDGDNVQYQRDGSPSSGPALPPVEQMERYQIALHDLLQKDTRDRTLAELIIREAAGGYQIAEAVQSLGYRDNPSRKGQTTREAENLIAEFRETEKKQWELKNEEQKLSTLYQELGEIKEARQKLEIVKQVIIYQDEEEKYRGVYLRLKGFPEEMSALTGEEEDRLGQLKGDIKTCRQEIKGAEADREKARLILNEVNLAAEGIAEGVSGKFFTELKNRRDHLVKEENRIEQHQDELKKAETLVREEEKLFIDSISGKGIAELESTAYQELNSFARKAAAINHKYESLKTLKGLLKLEEDSPGEEGVIQHGIRFLEEWLQAPENESSPVRKELKRLTLTSGLIISIMTLLLSLLVTPWFSLFFLLAGGIVYYGYTGEKPGSDYRKKAREDFSGLEIEPPVKWEKTAVRRRLQELASLEAEIKLWQSRKDYWRYFAEEYREIKTQVEEINRERERLIKEHGFAPGIDEQTLYYLTEHIIRWQKARNNVKGVLNELKESKERFNNILEKTNQMLNKYGYDRSEETAQISGYITDLEERNRRFQEASRLRAEAEKVITVTGNKLEEALREKKALYIRLSLEEDDEAGLRELTNLYQDYLKVKDELEQKDYDRKREKDKLFNLGDFDQSLLQNNLLELRELEEEYILKVEEHDQVYKRINEIETKIKTAREDNQVEEALMKKERALDRLEEELDDEYSALAGKVLADYIKEVHTVENRPEVLRKARGIFAEITRGNYQLEISEGEPPSFRAVDTGTGLGKGLDELSSGTRIQLLLAVRLAFVSQEERELTLPIYLDETLANADDQRAQAIIEAVIELTRRGRQCFYFTAQVDEVRKWVSILEKSGDIDYKLVDLSKEQGRESSWQKGREKSVIIPELDRLPVIEDLPAVAGMSHEEYGNEIAVPVFIPRKGAGSIHLWYMIEDLKLLEYFLKLGLNSWGQLKTLLEKSRDKLVPADKLEPLQEIEYLGMALEEFVDSWKVGRGKLVDRSVLLDSEAVSNNFIDQVASLAREVQGDARIIVKELRQGTVPNFLSRKTADLESYLEAEGYIDTAEPLTVEEIYLRMLAIIPAEKKVSLGRRIHKLLERINHASPDNGNG